MSHDCVYVTSGWSGHDDRWTAALRHVGFTPLAFALGRDASDPLDLRQAVSEAASGSLPVLAGPLDTVTRLLVGLPNPLVGLSWEAGLDHLSGMTPPTWLTQLSGLIVGSPSEVAAARAIGVADERVTLLPWGVDLQAFPFHAPWIDAFRLGVPPHAHLVLSLAPHEPRHRVADVIEAFARVPRRPGLHEDFPDAYLIVAGTGTQTDALAARARALGIAPRTRFIGPVSDRDLVPLLGRAACAVLASEDPGPLTDLLQAMACGTPVLASSVHTHDDWVQDGDTGFTFPVGDLAGLAVLLDEVNHRYPVDVVERARARVERDADWTANVTRLRTALAGPPA